MSRTWPQFLMPLIGYLASPRVSLHYKSPRVSFHYMSPQSSPQVSLGYMSPQLSGWAIYLLGILVSTGLHVSMSLHVSSGHLFPWVTRLVGLQVLQVYMSRQLRLPSFLGNVATWLHGSLPWFNQVEGRLSETGSESPDHPHCYYPPPPCPRLFLYTLH